MYRMLQYVCCCLCVFSLEAAWTTPEPVSDTDRSIFDPQIAVDAAGNATAVWRINDGSNFIIQASTKRVDESWQDPENLSADGYDANTPQIAVNAAGNATAVWTINDGSHFIIQAKTKLVDGIWQDLNNLSTPGRTAREPQIAMDATGNATAVWAEDDGSNYIVQARTKPFGESWQDIATLSDAGQSAREPQIAVDADGNATAVWVRYNGSEYIIQASTKRVGESWQDPENLSADGYDTSVPQIAVNAAGDAAAVWVGSDGSNEIIQATTKPFGESWQDPVDLSVAGSNNLAPQIAVDADGNATAVWIWNDGSNFIVQASTKRVGESWQDPENLSADGYDTYVPQIAVDAAGNATAVWVTDDGSNYVVQAKTKPFGGSWQDLATLSEAGQDTRAPQIAVDAAGNVTAVWVKGNKKSGVVESSTQYTAPTVTSVVPNNGSPAGGTSVTITGNSFFGVTAVYFGSVPATSFIVVSPTEIIAIAPAGSLGTVDIQVVAAGGSSPITDADRYQYSSSSAPRPPRHFRGTNKKRHHCHEHKYVLRTHWKASRSTDTSAYHIYKRKKIVATIPSNSKRSFKTHLIWKHSWKKFSITAVNANNTESAHKKLKIEH